MLFSVLGYFKLLCCLFILGVYLFLRNCFWEKDYLWRDDLAINYYLSLDLSDDIIGRIVLNLGVG